METKSIFTKETLKNALSIAENPRQYGAAVDFATNMITGGEKTQRQIMEANGYSSKVARDQPHNITKSKSFQAILDTLLSDEVVVSRHAELMEQNDNLNVARYMVEMAYKVKGHLKDDGLPAGAALLGMMLSQSQTAQIEQPTIYADVEAESVKNDPTPDEKKEND